jgi:alkyl sulfatase BDS1-like metallo-beta-lactamase superfamily hydrolase
MADLIELSTRFIDSGVLDQPANRITHELSELGDGLAVVEAFSHSILFETDEGLLAFDASGGMGGDRVVKAIRGWSGKPFHTLVYTHGHVDHVGGSGHFLADAEARGDARPRVAGHENVARRFERYDLTNGFNLLINDRQFRGFQKRGYAIGGGRHFLPPDALPVDTAYRDRLQLEVGGLAFELRHARGETDDHSWAWIPSKKAICAGDFFIWNFPNAGNPQKVQRYPGEWAAALREMAKMGAELFLPAHGLPIAGRERIARVLDEVASALENLVSEVLLRMNAGAKLNDILHEVKVPEEVLAKPYLVPLYDDPEFVVRNVWRLYGGWYDGNPSHLQPARDAALAEELATLAGGAKTLGQRATALAEAGDLRLASHLIEYACTAAPADRDLQARRADIYQLRRDAERCLMAKGIYGYAAGESRERAEEAD